MYQSGRKVSVPQLDEDDVWRVVGPPRGRVDATEPDHSNRQTSAIARPGRLAPRMAPDSMPGSSRRKRGFHTNSHAQ